MTNMNDIQNLVDHAAMQSDRWLVLAIMATGGFAMFFFWRWMISDREKLAARLTEITDRHITSQEKVTEVVANNTMVMRETQGAMRDVQNAISHCRDRERG